MPGANYYEQILLRVSMVCGIPTATVYALRTELLVRSLNQLWVIHINRAFHVVYYAHFIVVQK